MHLLARASAMIPFQASKIAESPFLSLLITLVCVAMTSINIPKPAPTFRIVVHGLHKHLPCRYLIHVHAHTFQISPRKINLLHELVVRSRDIVEGEDTVAELEEQIGTEGDESPERELEYQT